MAQRPVVVVSYDLRWPAVFAALRVRIVRALGEDMLVRIEHVGSTAVAGLAAKPVVDIDVRLRDDGLLPEAIRRLEAVGYRRDGDLGIRGREAFAQPAEGPKHHLYVCLGEGGSTFGTCAFATIGAAMRQTAMPMRRSNAPWLGAFAASGRPTSRRSRRSSRESWAETSARAHRRQARRSFAEPAGVPGRVRCTAPIAAFQQVPTGLLIEPSRPFDTRLARVWSA